MTALRLRSSFESLEGIPHLARMIDKMRAYAAGDLPPEYIAKLGVAFDGFVCEFLELDYDKAREAITSQNLNDDEAINWIKGEVEWPDEKRIRYFNTFLRKRGWRDEFRAVLPERLISMGFDDDGSIKTAFEMLEADEGRPVPCLEVDGKPIDGSGPDLPDHVRRRAAIFQNHAQPLLPLPTNEAPLLPDLGPLRAVIFDIYGTLIISGTGDISLAEKEDRGAQLRSALEAAGIAGIPTSIALDERFHACIKTAQNNRRAEGIEYPEVEIREVWSDFLDGLASDGVSFETPKEEALERLAIDYECRVNPVWPMPNLAPSLAKLASGGLTLGIVSNAQFYTRLMFPAFLGVPLADLGFALDCCVYSYSEREGKPSTALYEKLATRLAARGITPQETLYVGNDLRNDVWPAQLTGFKTALFAGDGRSLRWRKDDPRLDNIQPDAIVTDLWQIPALANSKQEN